MIKVTIIIPVYNVENYIDRCLNSVIQQDYPFIDCILVNDFSTDKSLDLLNLTIGNYKGDVNFTIFNHPSNKGAAASRNLGMRHSETDYIYFLDSDDEIYPDTISNLVNRVEKFPDVDIVQGEMYCENKTLNKILSIKNKNFPNYTNDLEWLRNYFLLDIPVSPCNKLINLKFLKENKIYFEEGVVHEDILWRFNLARFVNSIAFTTRVGYKYNFNSDSVMASPENDIKRIDSQIYVIAYISSHLSSKFSYIENLSLLKQFHYAKLMDVLVENNKYRNSLLKEQIEIKLKDAKLSKLFKISYLILSSDNFFKSFSWLWDKNMGLLFRIAKYKTRLALHETNE